MTRTILAAALVVASISTAQAAQWTRQPNGDLTCPGSYSVQRLDGQIIVVCPPDPITHEQADAYRRAWRERQDAEAARMAEHDAKEKERERAGILATCAKPDPSINQAWCANEMARLKTN